jgi:Fe2+ transport system protein FeoA
VLEVTPASPLSARLRELGVTPGCPVRVLRSGSPLVIQVGGGRFCLRREDAACIRARRTERPSLADAAG